MHQDRDATGKGSYRKLFWLVNCHGGPCGCRAGLAGERITLGVAADRTSSPTRVVERTRHIYDSQGQNLALTVLYLALTVLNLALTVSYLALTVLYMALTVLQGRILRPRPSRWEWQPIGRQVPPEWFKLAREAVRAPPHPSREAVRSPHPSKP